MFHNERFSHPGLPLHLASDGFTLRGHKTPPPCPFSFLPSATTWYKLDLTFPAAISVPSSLSGLIAPELARVQWEAADFTVVTLACFHLPSSTKRLLPCTHPHYTPCELLLSRLCPAGAAQVKSRAHLSHSAQLEKAWSVVRSQLLSVPTGTASQTCPISERPIACLLWLPLLTFLHSSIGSLLLLLLPNITKTILLLPNLCLSLACSEWIKVNLITHSRFFFLWLPTTHRIS